MEKQLTSNIDNIEIQLCKCYADAKIPFYASFGASGLDLYAYLQTPYILEPNNRVLVRTGIAIAIPVGYEGQVRPRSGLATKGITILNTPGTIDSDYRGEIKVLLINHSDENFIITNNMRIAQLVITPVIHPTINIVDNLDNTTRDTGGFGSTGLY